MWCGSILSGMNSYFSRLEQRTQAGYVSGTSAESESDLGETRNMEKAVPIPYETPTVTNYGTVQELTLGSGGTTTPDITPCAQGTFQANTPSGITCKVSS